MWAQSSVKNEGGRFFNIHRIAFFSVWDRSSFWASKSLEVTRGLKCEKQLSSTCCQQRPRPMQLESVVRKVRHKDFGIHDDLVLPKENSCLFKYRLPMRLLHRCVESATTRKNKHNPEGSLISENISVIAKLDILSTTVLESCREFGNVLVGRLLTIDVPKYV